MYRVLRKRVLNPSVTWMDVEAPLVARKAKAGQFVILRVNETGERIPLTIADYDREKGSVTIIFQKVGGTTRLLDTLEEGDYIWILPARWGAPPKSKASGRWLLWAAASGALSPTRPQKRFTIPAPGWT